ncbi:hypothetical protein DICPUDRAFT_84333 [Dictyostelium purpureum]|uniref:Uncharacterized protein n=1 Tax=Dictyostelium purpureum TaxID=5786 RepID=F1A2C0_DICPU|nr:uncharacterized protein DICPUDRAFT_84333 [Dictyostelium purpureum]EGC29662.1 hypothetical protein DICPUDRAFT_84333 [Dictyostelium purpureum]|eukprot:XP_003293815.1 hypothetical protein DICPUDRAFT_84333 [Dictyostelium purpureum]
MKLLFVLLSLVFTAVRAAQNYQFIHVSDIHYSASVNSLLYNATTSCIEPSSLSTESDHHEHDQILLKSKKFSSPTSGLFGRYGCDTNDVLLDEVMKQMTMAQPNPDFIIYTGDGAGHSLPVGPWQESQSTLAKQFLNSYPNTQIIPTIGNNDVFPDYNSQCGDNNLAFLYSIWSQWIPQDQTSSFQYRGSFSISPVPGLVVISLNTVLYSTKNKNVFSTPNDPCGQFGWLEQQLQSAQQNGDSVYIIGHIFPGLDPFYLSATWNSQYQTSFFNITTAYKSIINGGFFGHIHRDEIRAIQYANPSQDYFPMFIGSSVTPVYFNNPSFKVFTYSPNTNVVADYSAFFADVYISNLQGFMNWTKEYDFTKTFGISSQANGINGQVLNTLNYNMQFSNILFNTYDNFRSASYLADATITHCLNNAATVEELNACSDMSQTVAQIATK